MAWTTHQKFVWGATITSVVALGGLMLLVRDKPQPKKKSFGLTVDAQCNNYTVTNQTLIRDSIRAEVRAQASKGAVDPFQAARAFLRKAAPHCTTYPNNTRNPGEAALFILTFNTTLEIMEDEKLLSDTQTSTFQDMAKVWALDQGIPPGEFPG